MSAEGSAAEKNYFKTNFPGTTVDPRPDKDNLGQVFVVKDPQGRGIHRAHLTRELLDLKDDEVRLVLERHQVAEDMRKVGTTIVWVSSEKITGYSEEA
jgi:hypothetical protein